MDMKNLERLRALYGDADGGKFHNPLFAKVAAGQFKGDKRKWPFADVSTFLDAPYRPELQDDPAMGGLDVALMGIPMDFAVTNRSGTRLGPRAVRAIERIGPFDHVLKVAPLQALKVADIGDVPMRSRYSLEQCHEDIAAFYEKVARAGVLPLSVGGDHSMTYSILKGLAAGAKPGAKVPGMVHIDAHADTSGTYEGSKLHHGGPFRQAVLDGVLDPQRTIQIGIRGGGVYLSEFSYESGMTVIHGDEIDTLGIPAIIAKARAVVGDGPVYVSFDIDSLDPAFAPGTGTPEVGGLTPREVIALLRGLAGIDIIGGDVVEVAPQYDTSSVTAQCGAQMLFQLLCLVAIKST